MSRRLFVNGYELDLLGSERIATTYQASPVADLPAAKGFFSVEFTVPYTGNNRRALGLPDNLPNSSTIPFSLLPAQYQVDGIDMKIDSAMVVSVQSGINIRLYGGFASLLNSISDKSIRDLDLSEYDHIRSAANIQAKLTATTGYFYPIINYLDDLGANHIHVESMYPAIFAYNIIDKILSEAGYTLDGDLVDDIDYKSVIIPFSNKEGEYSTAFIDGLKSNVYVENSTTYDGIAIAAQAFNLTGTTSDPFDLVWNDLFPKYHALIRATYDFRVYVKLTGTPSSNVTVYLMKSKLNVDFEPFVGVGVSDGFEIIDNWNVTGTDFVTGTAIVDHTVSVELNKTEKVWIAFSKTVDSVTVVGGSANTFLEVTDVTNYGIFIDDLWQVAGNLPDIKQTDFLKYFIQAFSCIAELKDESKTLKLTKFVSVVNNFERDDWSDKLDLTVEPTISYPLNLAQSNSYEYEVDENIVTPDGTNYTFGIANRNLELSKVFYKAPFGATTTSPQFTSTTDVPIIDILSNQLKNRVLVYRANYFITAIHFHLAGVSNFTANSTCVPYFIEPDQSFNLGWATNLLPLNGVERINTLTMPRILKAKFKLTPSDINQLDFTKPVWIDKYNSYFYKMKIEQFEAGESTLCELLEI